MLSPQFHFNLTLRLYESMLRIAGFPIALSVIFFQGIYSVMANYTEDKACAIYAQIASCQMVITLIKVQ